MQLTTKATRWKRIVIPTPLRRGSYFDAGLPARGLKNRGRPEDWATSFREEVCERQFGPRTGGVAGALREKIAELLREKIAKSGSEMPSSDDVLRADSEIALSASGFAGGRQAPSSAAAMRDRRRSPADFAGSSYSPNRPTP